MAELERQLESVQALIAGRETEEEQRANDGRNGLLSAMAVFSVLNLSAVFAILNYGNPRAIFRGRTAIVAEFWLQFSLFVIVLFTLVGFFIFDRWHQR